MSKKALVIPKPTFYYKDLPAGHARLEVPTSPNLPVDQYLMIMTYTLSALYNTYEAFRTLSSSDKSWPPDCLYGRFKRDENGHVRFYAVQPHIIGEPSDKVYEDKERTLQISSWHYGSPTLLELVGIEKIIEMTGGAITYIDNRKHTKRMQTLEEQKTERDLALKDYELWEKWYDLCGKRMDTLTKFRELVTPELGGESIPPQLLLPPPPSLEVLTGKTELYLEE